MDSARLLKHLRGQFQLDWDGHHGGSHWSRVRRNGLLLAKENGANATVVELFAFFHDSRRENEHRDPAHGLRGAQLAQQLRGDFFHASDVEMDTLIEACCLHSDGHTEADITIQTCWDADRLDLNRDGIIPNPKFMSTEFGREIATHGSLYPYLQSTQFEG